MCTSVRTYSVQLCIYEDGLSCGVNSTHAVYGVSYVLRELPDQQAKFLSN